MKQIFARARDGEGESVNEAVILTVTQANQPL